MAIRETDNRSAGRRVEDEQIANEPKIATSTLPAGTVSSPIDNYRINRQHWRPVAIAGVVENGLVRPLDPAVKLAENSRVIIVATEPN